MKDNRRSSSLLPGSLGLYGKDDLSSRGDEEHKKRLRVAVPDGHLWQSTAEIMRRGGYPLFNSATDKEATGLEFEEGERVEDAYVHSPHIDVGVFRPQKVLRLVETPTAGRFHVIVNAVDISTEDVGDYRPIPDLDGKLNDITKLEEEAVRTHFEEMGLRCEVFAGGRPTRLCLGFSKEKYGVEEDFITPHAFMGILREYHGDDQVTIASEYPNIAKKYCNEMGINAAIMPSSGLTENYILKGVTDFIIDTIETGRSRRARDIGTVLPGALASGSVVVTTPRIYETVLSNGLGNVYKDFRDGIREGLKSAQEDKPELFSDGLRAYRDRQISGN